MSNPAPASLRFSAKPSLFTLPVARLLFNLAFPQANRLTPHSEGPCISTRPQNPWSSGTCAPKALRPLFELLLFWSPDSAISRREKPALARTLRLNLICQKTKGRTLQPVGGWGPTQTERGGRKKERVECGGERV